MANIGNKYRVHEVAKDFGLSTKQITEILTEYAQTPKNHMQVLEDHELSLIFEYLTQHNPVSGIQVIFAEGMKPAAEKKAEPAPEKKTEPKREAAKGAAAPKAEPAQKKAEAKPAQPVSRVPKTKVVDTSKATNINLAKYDEKLQDMADARSHGRRDQQQTQGKEKFRNSKQRRDNNFVSNKRKQEEADRLRRLRLEVIKKTPVTVQIPDEISVGELASRMKKTGAEVVKCLMKNGVMASLSQMIDFDTAAIIAEEMGCKVEKEVVVTIVCSERFHFARRTMEPMRPYSMKTISFCQIVYNLCQPGYTFFPVDKVSFDSHQQAGNSKSATSNRNYILVLLWINVIKMYTFAGQSGSLFRTFPHIVEMRLLNIVE